MNENPINEQLEFLKPKSSPDGFGNLDYQGEVVLGKDDIEANSNASSSREFFQKKPEAEIEKVEREGGRDVQLELQLEVDKIKAELMESGIQINDEPNKPSEFDEDDDDKLSPYEELYGRKL